ncbi:MAG: type I 3-dehydroquinate dehydratase [Deltaproteobacteria bacterium CG_4_10_14_3_um_filter_60_8]|nr:MAG: type I 3-dehydroquinate dehydratase [Desulfobacterales bacterium CG2_30_60_27]PIP44258.1 MAG: type I 3-dehydroquinate dehydratase [Deltaproteobacteria bacterium CG23_combo_of_CG06-09_8_20_14_all_60_8]PIY21338.1 MAG: type I 3-dehydroquinate dehydratase [Deltaproteobacteria bacterium CG_4_10_14_3_um_filter_60_8]
MTTAFHCRAGTPKICVSIAAATTALALAAARAAEPVADVLEIRLDSLADPALAPFLATLGTPLLFTNRPVWEGGQAAGQEIDRVALLVAAAQAGAAYVDIELRSERRLFDQVRTAADSTAVIASWHDFAGTPDTKELTAILRSQQAAGATIGKIVTTAHTFQDVLRVLNLQTEAAALGFPLIAFCMGQAGLISRIATLELGGFMTYAAPDTGSATAPGQLPASIMRTILASLGHGH